MKIVNIVPGFGGTFYCGNCLRDSGLMKSLRKAGHNAVTLPVYLPLTLNGTLVPSEIPVFYGAVNIYLKQQFPLLRKMPGWLERAFNSPAMMRMASAKAGSTRAEGMEKLTESMLLGKEGNQAGELQQLVDYLKHIEKPDVVHFSNALLLGMAGQIREEVKASVVCSLQDEDIWVDAMKEEYRDKMWKLMAEKAGDVDAFIAVSQYFAAFIQEKLAIPEEKIHVVHIGVDKDSYAYHQPVLNPQVIGYLSRICHENGFEILVDAFLLLKKDSRFQELKLKATGGSTNDDKIFIHRQIRKLRQAGISVDAAICNDFSRDNLQDFFSSLTVMSVPVLKGEAFGLYQLEAMASGIPLVQPALGAFPEVIELSSGGVIYQPNTAEALAEKLAEVLSDTGRLNEMSLAGRKAIEEKFNCEILTRKMVEIYHNIR
ncbi:MAG: glycosyltransferase family 4 protein [Bacteroidetes bacterium]|nr:glycosyltransferase family 4 protein [Bacteroidota bacterium]